MKKLLLIIVAFPVFGFAQQTITSVQNGNASSPLTWDCLCFPTTDDNIIINHAINMDVDWAITAGGSITVNSTGSLMQQGLRGLLVDGTGSFYSNNGSSAFNNVAYTNGGSGTNTGNFSVTEGLYIGTTSSYTNNGTLSGIDSLLTDGDFVNTGSLFTGNFLNTGTFSNAGQMGCDSVGNTGNFTSNGGYMYFNAFGNSGTFTMSSTGFMDVAQNWFNIGDFTLEAGTEIMAHNDFFNGDTLGGTAYLTNNGMIQVWNDLYNGYSMDGSGKICVANDSYNAGSVNGTLDFCDNTGNDFDLNLGTIAGTITYCQTVCNVGIQEMQLEIIMYPNPSQGHLTVESTLDIDTYFVYTLAGALLQTGKIDGGHLLLDNLSTGTYLIKFASSDREIIQTLIIQ